MTFKQVVLLIIKYLGNHKKQLYFCFGLSLVASVSTAYIPKVLGFLADEAGKIVNSGGHFNEAIIKNLVGFFLLSVFSYLSQAWVNVQGRILGNEVFSSFESDLFSHYLRLPVSFHKGKKSGEVVSQIEKAADRLWQMMSQAFFRLVPSILTALVVIGFMFYTNWKLTIPILLLISIYIIITVIMTKPLADLHNVVNDSWIKTSGVVHDSFKSVDTVKIFSKENYEIERINNFLRESVNKEKKLSFKEFRMESYQKAVEILGSLAFISLSVFFLGKGEITFGLFLSFFAYIRIVFGPLSQLTWMYQGIQRSLVVISDARKILEEEVENSKGERIPKIRGDVSYKNVSFSYTNGSTHLLKNISFDVKAGQVVGIVGESGTGKSTVLSLLTRFYSPKEGKVLVDGLNVSEMDLEFLRSQIAIVPQEPSLFNEPLLYNLKYGKPKASEEEVIKALKDANAWEFIQELPNKLNYVVGEKGVKLSTGQKQRIAIARALLCGQRIIILDEATSAQDSKSENIIQEGLFNLPGKPTIFIIAHRLSTIINADNILTFSDGCLVEQGTHNELMNKEGVYSSLYLTQNSL